MAVARPGGSGRTCPPPRPAPLPPPPAPSPLASPFSHRTSSLAGARPSGRTASPGMRRREGEAEVGALAGGVRGRARGRPASSSPSPPLGRSLERCRPGLEFCSFPPNYLSEPVAGAPKEGAAASRRGLTIPRAAPTCLSGPRVPASPLSSLLCCLYSRTMTQAVLLPLGVGADAQQHSAVPPSASQPAGIRPPRHAPRGSAAAVRCPRAPAPPLLWPPPDSGSWGLIGD